MAGLALLGALAGAGAGLNQLTETIAVGSAVNVSRLAADRTGPMEVGQ